MKLLYSPPSHGPPHGHARVCARPWGAHGRTAEPQRPAPGEAAAPPLVESALGTAVGAQLSVVLQVAVPQQPAQDVQELVKGELVVLVLVCCPEQLADEVRLPPALRKGGRSAAAQALGPAQTARLSGARWRGAGAGGHEWPHLPGACRKRLLTQWPGHHVLLNQTQRAEGCGAPGPGPHGAGRQDRRCRRGTAGWWPPGRSCRAGLSTWPPAGTAYACPPRRSASPPAGTAQPGGFTPAAPQGGAHLPLCLHRQLHGGASAGRRQLSACWGTCQGLFMTPRPLGRVQNEGEDKAVGPGAVQGVPQRAALRPGDGEERKGPCAGQGQSCPRGKPDGTEQTGLRLGWSFGDRQGLGWCGATQAASGDKAGRAPCPRHCPPGGRPPIRPHDRPALHRPEPRPAHQAAQEAGRVVFQQSPQLPQGQRLHVPLPGRVPVVAADQLDEGFLHGGVRHGGQAPAGTGATLGVRWGSSWGQGESGRAEQHLVWARPPQGARPSRTFPPFPPFV